MGTETRVRHAGKWRTDTGLPGGCGLMAAMCVLGMVRSSRRLTACDVVVVRPCDQAATSVLSWVVMLVVVQRQVSGHGLWLSRGSSSSPSPRRLLEEFLSWVCSRCSHFEKWCIIPLRPRIWQPFLGVWVLLVEDSFLGFFGR